MSGTYWDRYRRIIECKECGETKHHGGRGLCKTCYNRWYRKHMRNEGRCIDCGEPTERGALRCKRHTEIDNERTMNHHKEKRIIAGSGNSDWVANLIRRSVRK